MRAFALILSLLLAGAAAAQDFPEIARAKTALNAAAAALKKAQSGDERLAALSRAVTAHEAALGAYREGLRAMASREAQIQQAIDADRDRLESLIVALQSLSQAPRSALLAVPGGPVGAARGASLMAEISPVLQERIGALRDQLTALRQIRSSQEVARVEARGALAALQDLRVKTAQAIRARRRRDLAPRSEIRAQADAAAEKARTIGDLAEALKATTRTTGGRAASFAEARGLIQLPVRGRVSAEFGAKDPWGRAGHGLTISAPAYAQVTAPWDGTVRYAGPLIDYGNVVVLEPDKDTLIVLAGLGSVDRTVGETVLAGERLGDLGGPIPASDEFLLEATTDRDEIEAESLYMELRRNGVAVDPALWFDLTERGNGG